ncbi:hypothetical protein [Bradyrhizobium diazoefficiens]|uniref:hypothetical protein n=1 Tax=Bradyrhizobium diazoefficiens TaxID=1355477 RepID=UPI002715600A|nr:hypothetical protein [Bradyrhizobium diazoefficiens]WLB42095.1 hypothetical protein QIH78_20580 [Bradyrhizobium diazoefficiens]
MRLAANTFALQLGDRSFDLKPSLRAAFDLHHKHGFPELYQAILDGSYTASMDLIAATSEALPAASISTILNAREQLLEFVLILSGAESSGGKSSGEPMTFDDYFTKLFQIGTGWLGWTADDTWDATPAEIMAAHAGRLDMLKAIFGSGKDDQAGSEAPSKHDLNAIGDLTNHVRPR